MVPTPRHGASKTFQSSSSCSGVAPWRTRQVAGGEAHRPRPRSVAPAHILKTVRGIALRKSAVSFERPRCCTARPGAGLSTLLSPLEWRGSWREPPVVGVRFVARGHGDQGRLCEGSAHEFKADREAIRGEASRYNHGGKATIRG